MAAAAVTTRTPGGAQQQQGPRVYVFTITILRVTRIPSPMRLSFSTSSSFRLPARRSLKITVLHGSKQKELGEFDIVQDECLIDQRISCRLFCAKQDDLGKLHIYIDQAYSSGLAGHIALDLKEFLNDMDSEVYIKYPLSASSPREGYVPKLKMTLECTCLGNPENLFIPDLDTIIHHKQSLASHVEEHDGGGCSSQLLRRSQDGVEPSPEMNLLEELETVLFKLDSKLKNFVATCKTEDEKDIPVDRSTVLTRPQAEEQVEKGEDCPDCVVCSKSLLADKLQGLSSSLSSSRDTELRCSKNEFGSEIEEEQQRQQTVETKRRPNIVRNVLGGALLVGLSIFAATSFKRPRKFSPKRSHQDRND